MTPAKISIIIPVFNEEKRIKDTLTGILNHQNHDPQDPVEIIVVDGDTIIPANFTEVIRKILAPSQVVAGAFLLKINSNNKAIKLIEMMANWRSRLFSLPYGDQGIFLKRSIFKKIGGFQDLEIMEDFDLIQRLKKLGKISIAPTSVITCDRRWQKLGVIKTTVINQHLPQFCADHQVRIIASLPCYLENNVDQMRGQGVYNSSIKAIQLLNNLGYGIKPNLILDLVYNPALPTNNQFSLTPNQTKLEQDYHQFLEQYFNLKFNRLLTITNLPIGRTKLYLEKQRLITPYLSFLESNFNDKTLDNLMCKNQLSIDYLGNIYDCDFNQMENLPSPLENGEKLTVAKLLEIGNLDVIEKIETAPHCYGCTAGSGSSCGGALT